MKLFSLMVGAAIAFSTITAHADDVLWNISFKDLPAGQPPVAAPFAAPSTSPQRVMTDAQNTLVGAKAVGPLNDALLFDKETNSHYLPAMMLTASSGYTTGVVTIQFDLAFDHIVPGSTKPVEVLMAFPLVKDNGGMDVIPVATCNGSDSLFFGVAGIKTGSTKFGTGQVAHVKMVMDLDKHTLQIFVNDIALGDPVQDDAKLASFRGITFRDGTGLGGGTATFTAGLANISITKS